MREAIILPLIKTYQPPYHHRNRKPDELEKIAMEVYGSTLGQYSPECLRKAWNSLKNTHKTWNWPTIPEIVEHCDETPVKQGESGKKYTWDLQRENVEKYRDELLTEWFNNPIVQQAKEEGWYYGLRGLRNYIWEHADYQAQRKAGCRNIGYDAWAWGWCTWLDRGEEINLDEKLSPRIIEWMKWRYPKQD